MRGSKYRLTPAGAIFDEDIGFEEWNKFGKMAFVLSGAMLWYVGDWINFGEKKFGEKYSQALDCTKYDYGTLRNAAWVANRVPVHIRRPNLSWRHHAEVAKFKPEDQNTILDMAQSHDMSSNSLREFLHKQYPGLYKLKPAQKTTFDGWWQDYSQRLPSELVAKEIMDIAKDSWQAASKVLDK